MKRTLTLTVAALALVALAACEPAHEAIVHTPETGSRSTTAAEGSPGEHPAPAPSADPASPAPAPESTTTPAASDAPLSTH